MTIDGLQFALRRLERWGLVRSAVEAAAVVAARESEGSTYVGAGIAIPHIVGDAALHSAIAVIECEPFGWADHEVDLLIFVLLPELGLPEADELSSVIEEIAALTMRRHSGLDTADLVLEVLRNRQAHLEATERREPVGESSSRPMRGGYLIFGAPRSPDPG